MRNPGGVISRTREAGIESIGSTLAAERNPDLATFVEGLQDFLDETVELQAFQYDAKERPRIMHLQRTQMLFPPGRRRIDHDILYPLTEPMQHRDRQPLPPLRRPDAIPVLPFVLLELDRVQQDEEIGRVQLIEVAQPGEVMRLVDCDPHRLPPPVA